MPYAIGELTLGDLADLQGRLDDARPDPLADLRPRLDSLEGEARRGAILAAFDAATAGVPGWAGPWTPGARLLDFFLVALARHRPRLGEDAVAAAALATTAAEFAALERVLYGVDAVREIHGLLGMLEAPGEGEPVTWAEAVVETAEQFGYTLGEMGRLTLSQFRALRRGGKPESWGVPVASGADIDAMRERQRARMLAAGGGEGEGAGHG